jgi:hypothetical protein
LEIEEIVFEAVVFDLGIENIGGYEGEKENHGFVLDKNVIVLDKTMFMFWIEQCFCSR